MAKISFGVSGVKPSKVGGIGLKVKYFPRLSSPTANPIFGAITPSGVFLQPSQIPPLPSSQNATGALLLPASGRYEGQWFNVLAGGSFGNDTGDPSGTVQVKLYAVTGSTFAPIYTVISSTTAFIPQSGTPNSWAINASLFGESGSGFLGGYYTALVNGAFNNNAIPKQVDSIISGLNFLTGSLFGSSNQSLGQGVVVGFAVGVIFGTSDATNTASLFQFDINS